MRILAASVLVPCLCASAAVPAQSLHPDSESLPSRWRIPIESEPRISGPGVTLPVITYTAPDGSLKLKRGIVVGREVAPNATIGLGLFETLPKKPSRPQSDNPMERTQKRSRKAAVGLTFSF